MTPADGTAARVDPSMLYLGLSAPGGCLVLVGLWFALSRKVTMIVGQDTLTRGQACRGRTTVLARGEIAGIEVVTHRYNAAATRHLALMLTEAAARRLGEPDRRSGGGFNVHTQYTDAHLSVGVFPLAEVLVARA